MKFNDLFNIKHNTVSLEENKGVLINADCMKVLTKLSDNRRNKKKVVIISIRRARKRDSKASAMVWMERDKIHTIQMP